MIKRLLLWMVNFFEPQEVPKPIVKRTPRPQIKKPAVKKAVVKKPVAKKSTTTKGKK